MKQSFMERLQTLQRYCHSHDLSTPDLISPLLELNLITAAMETVTDGLQALNSVCHVTVSM
jgi:hypothetical protein